MGSRCRSAMRGGWGVGLVLCCGTGCQPGNWIDVALGNDIMCGQHASGRWDCYGDTAIEMPRDDYLAMSADNGVACGIRPEDHGVECFGDDAPKPPAVALRSLRYYENQAYAGAAGIHALSADGGAMFWGDPDLAWVDEGGRWDSFTSNSWGGAAYQSGTQVRYVDNAAWADEPVPDGFDEIAAFDIGETGNGYTWIGTDGCFRAEGTMTVGALSEIDCSGPFQPIVVGGLAGNYALAEDGTIHQLDTVDLDGDRLECGAPDGEFKALARGGRLTCGIRTSGSLVCWGPNTRSPDWLNAISEPYAPGEQGGGECDFRD